MPLLVTKSVNDWLSSQNRGIRRLSPNAEKFVEWILGKYDLFKFSRIQIRKANVRSMLEFLYPFIVYRPSHYVSAINKNDLHNYYYNITKQTFVHNPIYFLQACLYPIVQQNLMPRSDKMGSGPEYRLFLPTLLKRHKTASAQSRIVSEGKLIHGQTKGIRDLDLTGVGSQKGKSPNEFLPQNKEVLRSNTPELFLRSFTSGLGQRQEAFPFSKSKLQHPRRIDTVASSAEEPSSARSKKEIDLGLNNQSSFSKKIGDEIKLTYIRKISKISRNQRFKLPELEYSCLNPKTLSPTERMPGKPVRVETKIAQETANESSALLHKVPGSLSGQSAIDMNRMADQVYRMIEKKMQIENERSGRWY